MDGIEATRRIRALTAPPRVIILTTLDLDEYVFSGLHAGASGFPLKDTLAADLISAERVVVVSGEAVAARSVTRRLVAHFLSAAPARPNNPSDWAT